VPRPAARPAPRSEGFITSFDVLNEH
jgi:hypothetical protein